MIVSSESMVSEAEMSILGVHHLSVPKTPILPIEKPFFSESESVVASTEFVPTIRSGSHTDKGHRQFNEDEHILIDHLSTQLPSLFLSPSPTSFYAVFDGHGGSNAASSYLKQNYTKLFFQEANFPQKPQELEDYNRKAFLRADQALADNVPAFCGTTALTAIVIGKHLFIANAGDSRAVLCRKGVSIQMSLYPSSAELGSPRHGSPAWLAGMAPRGSAAATAGMRRRRLGSSSSSAGGSAGFNDGGTGSNALRFYTDDAPGLKISPTVVLVMSLCFIVLSTLDHRPTCLSERKRVEDLGGYFDNDGYLNGDLGVTRALGDWYMKFPIGSSSPLIAEPEFQHTVLTEDDEFLIVACDGVWDVMSNQDAVRLVRGGLRSCNDPQQCARELVNEAVRLNACDNLTAIVVCFTSGIDCRDHYQRPRLRCCNLSEEAKKKLRSLLEGNSDQM
ncbi:unnamed protein product [Camellia sinensis]